MTREKIKKITQSKNVFNQYASQTDDYDSEFGRVTECAEFEF